MKTADRKIRAPLTPAFTLGEVLLVLVVVAALAYIFLPIPSRSRADAQRASCQSNLKQIGFSLAHYAADYGGKLPATSAMNGDVANYTEPHAPQNWIAAERMYSKSQDIFLCPSAAPYSGNPSYEPRGFDNTAYTGNGVVFIPRGKRLASIPNPSAVACVQESRFAYSHALLRPLAMSPGIFILWHQNNGAVRDEYFSALHYASGKRGGDLLYCDGHVKWRPGTSLTAADFGLTGGIGATGSAGDKQADVAGPQSYKTYRAAF